jgi:hypothetical protein
MHEFVALVRRTDGVEPAEYTVNVEAANLAAVAATAAGKAQSIWGVEFEFVSAAPVDE